MVILTKSNKWNCNKAKAWETLILSLDLTITVKQWIFGNQFRVRFPQVDYTFFFGRVKNTKWRNDEIAKWRNGEND